jgi:hypothetical protein
VLAAAEVARDPQRLTVTVDDDDGVRAIFMALPAVILDRLTCPKHARHASSA